MAAFVLVTHNASRGKNSKLPYESNKKMSSKWTCNEQDKVPRNSSCLFLSLSKDTPKTLKQSHPKIKQVALVSSCINNLLLSRAEISFIWKWKSLWWILKESDDFHNQKKHFYIIPFFKCYKTWAALVIAYPCFAGSVSSSSLQLSIYEMTRGSFVFCFVLFSLKPWQETTMLYGF